MAEKDADVQKIQELIKIMKDNDLVKIDIKHGNDRISLRRAGPPQPAAANPIIASLPGAPVGLAAPHAQPAAGQATDDLLDIKSPIVGTFYETPSPDSDPYVEIGSHVNAQSVVCIIEAMKVMNEIKAEISGTIVDRCVANGQAVEYGQVLFKVRPE
ncbi:acetyl-CoA carboxylase biotin carboxyl carrier protein [Anaerobaca lacustris]|uniref:Biotin carboxyl carrier protein of acetyl-CoA carboxylase n=1 Tax=Anaerobaca lacustris TaxID=3044600 RepID=A0AAW6TUW7_9BACT|nr:acetyl-CoA carboxylase biotin carboxyl carrier protein [Sedimentisphaerales bacterium M17dextr]